MDGNDTELLNVQTETTFVFDELDAYESKEFPSYATDAVPNS